MSINDFNLKKPLEVVSVSGTPTISRALPIKVTSGDDSTTGIGEVVLDWSNISSQADIGVYDENDNLLDYHFESFDATNETAVIWVYRDWVRDGSVQAKIAYGSGPSDQSVAASTVFDKESNLQAGYLLNESSGDALDVTSNNNDGTVYGATQGADGIVGGAYSFDGSDDEIEISDDATLDGMSKLTILAWTKLNSENSSYNHNPIVAKGYWADPSYHLIWSSLGSAWEFRFTTSDAGDVLTKGMTSSEALGTWCLFAISYDGSTARFYVNDVEEDTTSITGSIKDTSNLVTLAEDTGDSTNRNIDGLIDHAAIYSEAFSSDDIFAFYAATKSSPDFFSQAAVISTDSPTNITSSSATLNGTLESLKGNSSLDVYFEYGTDTSYGNTTSTQTISSVPTSFSADISGLTAFTTYHYRAVATDGSNYWYGNDVSFCTADLRDVDETQSDFQDGTLNGVEADAEDYLRLADTNVLSFDGADDYVTIPGPFSSDPTSISVSFWFKLDDTEAEYRALGYNEDGFYLSVRLNDGGTANKIYVLMYDGSVNEITTTAYTLTEWTHIAVTSKENDETALYVNGDLISTVSVGSFSETSDLGRTIGASRSAGSSLFHGKISDFRIWNIVRTQTEIQDNMNKHLNGDETGLVVYYKLDEGSGDTATDSAGSNDGTINGACLPGYTEVLTTEGNKRIDEINIGDKIISYTNDGPVVQKVEQFHDQGVKQTYELRTGNRRIFATDNHPFLTAVHIGYELKETSYQNKVKTRTWELQWKRLDELETGDAIVVYTGGCLPQENTEISENLCKIIGCYLGDGYIIHRKGDLEGIGFSLFEQQKRNKYEQLVSDEFERNPSTYKDIVLYSKNAAYYFSELGLDKKCLYKKNPNWAFSLPKEKKEAIIEGFLDSDGFQNKHGDWIFELANEQLIKDLRWLAIEAGYEVSNIRYRDRRNNYSNIEVNRELKGIESWTFSIYPNYSKNKGVHRINKLSKKERVHIDLPDGYKFQNISSIKKYSEEKVYDIGLKDIHNFVAEGIVVHNSWTTDRFELSPTQGNRTVQLDLSSLSKYSDSLIEWTATLNGQSLTIETRYSLDGGSSWSSWQTATSGSAIPGLSGGDDLSNALLECRETLSTSDTTSTPQLERRAIYLAEETDSGGIILTASAGSYSWNGTQASAILDAIIQANSGSYQTTGSNPTLLISRLIDAVVGSYALSGGEAGLTTSFLLVADSVAYVVSGKDASLTQVTDLILSADPGTYAISGSTADMLLDLIAQADPGTYSVSGSNITASLEIIINAVAGSYALSGSSAETTKDFLLVGDSGVYVYSGADASLAFSTSYSLAANPGVYSISGETANLIKSLMFSAGAGSYTVEGDDSTLSLEKVLSAMSGMYSTAGQDFVTVLDRVLAGESGSYQFSGNDAEIAFVASHLPRGRVQLIFEGRAPAVTMEGAAPEIDFEGRTPSITIKKHDGS